MNLHADGARLGAALSVVLGYLLLCAGVAWDVHRRQRATRGQAAALSAARAGAAPMLVAYASQTGYAESLAWSTGQWLHTAGEAVRVLPLNQVTPEVLATSSRALFIASTYGEGDAPDNASVFVGRHMEAGPDNGRNTATTDTPAPDLHPLRYAVLALGDRQYDQFCGFGRRLDDWLAARGAQALFARIEVDNADPVALADWRQQLGQVVSLGDAPLPDAGAPGPAEALETEWMLVARRLLNPGSAGQPVLHIELRPAPAIDGTAPPLPHWESGDLVRLRVPTDPDHPREYSIGSVPADGSVHLLVRQTLRADGSPGRASTWLAEQAALGDRLPLALRPHRNFRLEDNAHRPLVLIGNGTGLAGLRGHVRARAAVPDAIAPHWLLFGERHAAHDFLYQDELQGWLASGVLQRLDLAFSRDQPERIYVQKLLLDAADTLRQWIGDGAAIYVCGSLQGMAGGVDDALCTVLGRPALDDLLLQGRYRRDVY